MDVDGTIRRLSEQQYGAMSRRQLTATGVSRSAIRHRVAIGMLIPVGPRVLLLAGTPALAARSAMAAVLDAPAGSMLSHRSAAAWWGLPGFDLNGRLEVVVPRRGHRRGIRSRHGISSHRFRTTLIDG
jgi:hypothetical protein